jgi:membrane protein YdbS with pleckstrin-like domain
VVRADNAGSALDPKARQTGVDVFIPATSRAAAEAIVPLVVPGVDPRASYTRTSGTLWRRWTFRATVLAGAMAATLLLRGDAGWRVIVAGTVFVALPTVALVAGLLAHRRLGFRVDPDARCLAVRFGILGIYRAWVPFDRVQCVTLYATPFDRFAKVRHLQLVVTGGATLRLGYVPVETAEQLRRTLMGEVGEATETTSTHLPAPAWIG